MAKKLLLFILLLKKLLNTVSNANPFFLFFCLSFLARIKRISNLFLTWVHSSEENNRLKTKTTYHHSGQFHRHFTKVLSYQSQNVSREKLCEALLYKKFVDKMLMKLTLWQNMKNAFINGSCEASSGLNFISVLHTAFVHADPKSVKRYWCLMLSGSTSAKAAHKMLVKLTHGVNFINTLCTNFSYKSSLKAKP